MSALIDINASVATIVMSPRCVNVTHKYLLFFTCCRSQNMKALEISIGSHFENATSGVSLSKNRLTQYSTDNPKEGGK